MKTSKFLIVALLCLLVQLLLSSSTLAQQKSYLVEYIQTSMNVVPDSCDVVVQESITFQFTGPYSSVGRFFSYQNTYGGLTISNYKVSSNQVFVLTSYLREDDSKTGKYLVWDFQGVTSGVKTVTFTLSFRLSGTFKNVNSHQNTLFYSYKWGTSVGHISANVFVPINANKTDGSELSWTPLDDGRYIPYGKVGFLHGQLMQNSNYDITVTLPSSLGDWSRCKAKKPTFLGTVAVIVVIIVFVCICLACSVLCSIWQGIKRGLFPWAYTYNNGAYYDHGHHHHGHHGHHHHSSGGGYQNITSVSGSSGFAT